MIHFEKFILDNGLKVIVHQDKTTPIVAFNILYDVGARDEHPEKTGFAHLFEHLMFGGSVHIPSYDQALQKASGENNAYTTNDITNYYLTLPKQNLETAFWLESDRMLSLAFSKKSLDVQKNVVIEEFRQRYLNQPYGDVWMLLRPLAYKKHPYQWDTIGKEISHIESATLKDVKDFFFRYYAPNNAILVVAGDIKTDEVRRLAEKWFGPIEKRKVPQRKLSAEPRQNKHRSLTVKRNVPFDCLYKAYHMGNRMDKDYYATDLLSDILSGGKSSRFYRQLVQKKKMFSEIHAFILGTLDKGLFVVEGKLFKGKEIKKAEAALQEEIEKISQEPVTDYELQKVKNKVESALVFDEMNILDKAMNLAFFELLGDASLLNQEEKKYASVSTAQIRQTARTIFQDSNSAVLYYLSK